MTAELPSAMILDGVRLVLIPAGEFTMGSDRRGVHKNESARHEVYQKAFYIGKYPITNARVAARRGTAPALSRQLRFSGGGLPWIYRIVPRLARGGEERAKHEPGIDPAPPCSVSPYGDDNGGCYLWRSVV